MTMTTPDVEADILAKLAALLPADFDLTDPGLNARAGPLRPTSNVGAEIFVQTFGGTTDLHNDGRVRGISVQVTTRGARNSYASAHDLAWRIHDALDLLGSFVGASGATYMDVRAQLSGPNYLGPDEGDQELFGEPFSVWLETVRT